MCEKVSGQSSSVLLNSPMKKQVADISPPFLASQGPVPSRAQRGLSRVIILVEKGIPRPSSAPLLPKTVLNAFPSAHHTLKSSLWAEAD